MTFVPVRVEVGDLERALHLDRRSYPSGIWTVVICDKEAPQVVAVVVVGVGSLT